MEDVTAEEELTLVRMLYVDSCVRSVSLSLCVWCRMRSVGEHSKDKEDVLCGERGTENLDTLDTRHWICVTVSGNGGEMRSRALQCSSGAHSPCPTNKHIRRPAALSVWMERCVRCMRKRETDMVATLVHALCTLSSM